MKLLFHKPEVIENLPYDGLVLTAVISSVVRARGPIDPNARMAVTRQAGTHYVELTEFLEGDLGLPIVRLHQCTPSITTTYFTIEVHLTQPMLRLLRQYQSKDWLAMGEAAAIVSAVSGLLATREYWEHRDQEIEMATFRRIVESHLETEHANL